MKRIYGDELKKVQIEILDVVADFCEANQITYWIDSGTLLGAVRHKGYIPWDDDIDIGMLRCDYDRFSELFNSANDRYKFVCVENTPEFYQPFGKVCDCLTVLYEPDEFGNKLSINIDVFVYDNAPDDDIELKKMYDVRDSLRRISDITTTKKIQDKNIVKKTLKLIRRSIYRTLYPNRNEIIKMVSNAKKYSDCSTNRVGNFTAYTRMVCNKRVFDDFINIEFEGKLYKAPVGYDEWLKSFYGDYMKLPPEEKRISHHKFKAYLP